MPTVQQLRCHEQYQTILNLENFVPLYDKQKTLSCNMMPLYS